jgi:prepilin-type N-terminal cleavage/methylation domain-containing protein
MHPSAKERGFTLIELLVGIGLTAMLCTAVFTVFMGSQRAASGLNRVIENRQNSRTALQLLERDIRMLGSGWGRINVEGCYNGTALTISPITTGYGGSPAADDTIGIIGAWDLMTTLKSSMTNTTSTVKTNSGTGFAVNDFIVVTNDATAHLFQITSISNNDFTCGNSSKYNKSGGHLNWPSGGYSKGAKVYRVTFVSYQVQTTGGVRNLVRWQTSQTPQLVANNVGQFKVTYFLDDGSESRDPDDLTTIERIEPVLYTTASGAGLKRAVTDSVWASIKPRTF